MTAARLSCWGEFTPVPSHSSTFVYMIPPQTVMLVQVAPAWVHPGSCTGARISLRYEILQRYHVDAKQPLVSMWNRLAGRLERAAHVKIFVNPRWLRQLQHVGHGMMKKLRRHVNVIRNHELILVWNSCWCEFSHFNTPLMSVCFCYGCKGGGIPCRYLLSQKVWF